MADPLTNETESAREPSGRPAPPSAPASNAITRSQLLLYVGQQLAPEVPLYNMALAFRIDGDLDADCFRRAFQKCIERCDALRLVFTEEGGAPRQTVLPRVDYEMEIHDLSAEPDPAAAARAWTAARCRKPFAMGQPLFDSALFEIGERRFLWFLNQHHLITDAWATALLFRQAGELYRCALNGAADPPPPPQYLEFVAFEKAERARPAHQTVAAYWKEKLSTAPDPPQLYGKPRLHESTPSTRVFRNLDDATAARIREVAATPELRSFTPHLSLYNLFTTLLFAFVHRASGQKHLAIGAPAHNRPTQDLKETLGVFIELFPLHIAIDDDETFATLLRKVQAETGGFLRHATPGASDPAYNRCFNVVLNYINATFGDFADLPVSSEWVHPGHIDIGHHLRLQVHDFDATGRFALHFDFNDGVFDPDERATAVDHFLNLLDAFLADPDQVIAGVDLMSPAERTALLTTYNAPAAAPLPDRTVVDLFRAQARAHAKDPALKHGDRIVSFGELDALSEALAARLSQHGPLAGQPVGVCLRRSPEMIVAVLAILKAGGAFLPIDLRNPASRNQRILADASAKTILTATRDAALVPALPEGISLITVDDPGPDHATPSTTPRPEIAIPVSLDDLAYLIYTSGSTGTPKGVAITHGGIADYITWAERNYIRGDRLHYPLFTSLSFDLTLTSLFLPLVTGGTLVIYEDADQPVDTAVLDVLAANEVEFIKLTPSHLQMIVQAGHPANSKIARIIVGGEDFKTSLAREVQERLGAQAEIYNEYGPTEAVVGCMIHRFDPGRDTGVSVPIGRPADHVEIYVLDEQLRPLPRGVPGELCIARHGLANGYHGAAATGRDNERFVSHPFRTDARLYRSGDLARFHTHDSLEFLGRIDRQLKVSGFRLEPGEVEAALEAHPAVTKAIVTLRATTGNASVASGNAATGIPPAAAIERRCAACGMPSNYPGIRFDEAGLCQICADYRSYEEAARAYFKPMHELEALFEQSRHHHPDAEFDCVALLSGGKDSTYTLCRLVDLGLKVYAFTLDNNYLSDEAKANIRGAVESLGVRHEFGSTPKMPDIFRDSLMRFSNVCNGCFKTVYTLSMNRARSLGIPIVVTGLSRGQFFETRLTPDLFRNDRFSPDDVDAAVLEARKAYHRIDDAVSRSLDVSAFQDGSIFEDVRVVDFYRYCDVSVDEVYAFLDKRVRWKRPSDTGRSTNCLINDVGIYIHQQERGYHNYALPYSWDVRMAHKTRDEAIAELDDDIDPQHVRRILAEIGYDENRHARSRASHSLIAYYQSSAALTAADLREHLSGRLPPQLLPSAFVPLETIPLTANGKIDFAALPSPGDDASPVSGEPRALPAGPVEEQIAAIWSEVLGIAACDVETSFFTYGGASLQAMEAMLRICQTFDVQLPLQSLFQSPTVRQLAALVEDLVLAEIESLSDEEAAQQLQNQDH